MSEQLPYSFSLQLPASTEGHGRLFQCPKCCFLARPILQRTPGHSPFGPPAMPHVSSISWQKVTTVFQTAYPFRPHFSAVSAREVTAVAARSIPRQASCLFCQCTGNNCSCCSQHSRSSLMSLLSAHRRWPQFLRAAFTVKHHVSSVSAQEVTTVPVRSIHSRASCLFCQCTGSDCSCCIQSSLMSLQSAHKKRPQFLYTASTVKPATCVSHYMNTQKMTGFVDQLERGFIYEKSSEMCICLCWGLIVLRWPCAVDRMLKSNY